MSKKRVKNSNRFPSGWTEKRVRSVIRHYGKQSDAEAIAEDEVKVRANAATTMRVPAHLVAQVRAMIARDQRQRRSA